MIIKTPNDVALAVKQKRKKLKLTQIQLAGLCNVGVRFVSDLENAKPTCELNKTLKVLSGLGIRFEVEDDTGN